MMTRINPTAENLNKLSRYKFLLLTAVICTHSLFISDFPEGSLPHGGTETLLAVNNYIFMLAVPTFFIISGYLFFREGFLGRTQYERKIVSRMRSLIIPYFLWCTIGLLTVFLKKSQPLAPLFPQYAQWHPDFIHILTGYFSFMEGRPYDFVLWFIRNLIVIVILSPVIGYIFKKLGIFSLLLFFSAAYMPVPWELGVSLAYFSLGACISLFFGDIMEFSKLFGVYFLIAYLVICSIDVLEIPVITDYLYLFQTMTGSIAGIWLINKAYKIIEFIPRAIIEAAFFIFAFHGLFVTLLRKSITHIIPPTNSAVEILDFVIILTLTISICIAVAFAFGKIWPSGYSALSGFRISQNKS